MAATRICDVVVVGLGAMGAATLFQLAAQGIDCIGIDRFAPPHAMGSSHGETRITRCATAEGAAYAPLARRSHEIWRELEAITGDTLLEQVGCLMIAPAEAGRYHNKPDFLASTTHAANLHAVAHEMLETDELERRFPQLLGLAGERACFEPGGGFVYPERCIAAQLGLARSHGAGLLLDTVVRSIAQSGGRVVVETDAGRIEAARAVVATGAWTPKLLPRSIGRHITVARQVLHWFEVDERAYPPGGFPVFIWVHGAGAEDSFYGFPRLPGSGCIKLATEQYHQATDIDRIARAVAPREAAALYAGHVGRHLAGVGPRVLRSTVCMYSSTPDSDFIIDECPGQERITVISACSGHGFKHSAAIGEAVMRRVTGAPAGIDLAAFSLGRFAAG